MTTYRAETPHILEHALAEFLERPLASKAELDQNNEVLYLAMFARLLNIYKHAIGGRGDHRAERIRRALECASANEKEFEGYPIWSELDSLFASLRETLESLAPEEYILEERNGLLGFWKTVRGQITEEDLDRCARRIIERPTPYLARQVLSEFLARHGIEVLPS